MATDYTVLMNNGKTDRIQIATAAGCKDMVYCIQVSLSLLQSTTGTILVCT